MSTGTQGVGAMHVNMSAGTQRVEAMHVNMSTSTRRVETMHVNRHTACGGHACMQWRKGRLVKAGQRYHYEGQ